MSDYTDKYKLGPRMILKVVDASYAGDFRIRLSFNNNESYLVDLKSFIMGCGPETVFEPLKDVNYFKKFIIIPGDLTISWPNEADLAAEYLYELALDQNKSA